MRLFNVVGEKKPGKRLYWMVQLLRRGCRAVMVKWKTPAA